MKEYLELEKKFKTLHDLGGASSILHWDFACMMPKGSSKFRSEQLSTLNTISHNIITDKAVGKLLTLAEKNATKLNKWQKRNLELMRHSWIHSNAVDEHLVEELSKAGMECEMVWREARKNNDFKKFAPYQSKVIDLVREVAKAKGKALNCSPYDAMLDQYDSGSRAKDIDKVFLKLKNFLPEFIKEVTKKQAKIKFIKPKGNFPIETQRKIGLLLMQKIGFNFDNGRVDVSHHPFCGGTYGDIRITTRYSDTNVIPAIAATMHECGHAVYDSNLPEKWYNQPVGSALGMSMHESQSLIVEMQAGRSKKFLEYLSKVLTKHFPENKQAWSSNNLQKASSIVKPGLIRVDADEVTYPLHVILRYEIEKAIFAGDINYKDVPKIWNDLMWKYLGVKVTNYKDGCMQDIHWTDGAFGYFPSYTLGAMIAAQLYAAAKRDRPDIPKKLAKGDFTIFVDWLRINVHKHGSLYDKAELIKQATGQYLNPEIYQKHLIDRYLKDEIH